MKAKTEELKEYVAFCASCGSKLTFDKSLSVVDIEAISAICNNCSNKWSFVFDLDKSGTFGVISFQCDNEDRIINKENYFEP